MFALDMTKVLVLTVEFDYISFPDILLMDQIAHDNALRTVLTTSNAVKHEDCIITRTTLSNQSFNDVHSLPARNEIFSHPLSIELIYPDKSEEIEKGHMKVFGHVRVDLNWYDGVTALHTLFNVMECLEHGNIKNEANPREYLTIGSFATKYVRDSYSFKNFVGASQQVLSLLFYCLKEMISQTLCILTCFRSDYESWPIGPLSVLKEKRYKPRVYGRFTNVEISFKEVVKIASSLKAHLGIPWISYTMNYSPHIALGFASSFENLMRLGRVRATPIGPPISMDTTHACILSNSLFWNNYGKFNPNISAEVTGFAWDWYKMPNTFPPLFQTIQVKSRLLVMASFPEPLWRKSVDMLQKLGPCQILTAVGRDINEFPSSTDKKK